MIRTADMVAREDEDIIQSTEGGRARYEVIKAQYKRLIEEINGIVRKRVKLKVQGAQKMRLGLETAQHLELSLRRLDKSLEVLRYQFQNFITKHATFVKTLHHSEGIKAGQPLKPNVEDYPDPVGSLTYQQLVKKREQIEHDRLIQKAVRDNAVWAPLAAYFEKDIFTCFKFARLSVTHYELFVAKNRFIEKLKELAMAQESGELFSLRQHNNPREFLMDTYEQLVEEGTMRPREDYGMAWKDYTLVCSEILNESYLIARTSFDPGLDLSVNDKQLKSLDSKYATICAGWGVQITGLKLYTLPTWRYIYSHPMHPRFPGDFLFRVLYIRDWEVLRWILNQPSPEWSLKYSSPEGGDSDATGPVSWVCIPLYGLFWMALSLLDSSLLDLLWTQYGPITRYSILALWNLNRAGRPIGKTNITALIVTLRKGLRASDRQPVKEALTRYYNRCIEVVVAEFAGFHKIGENPEEDDAKEREILNREIEGTTVEDWIALEDMFEEWLEITKKWSQQQ